MNKILFLILALTLVSCSAFPQVTVTSTATVTVKPPPTETQLPTNTPEPPIYTEAQEFFGEGFEVTIDGRVIDKTLEQEIPGFVIVPFDKNTMINTGGRSDPDPTWAWERTYEFESNANFKVTGTQHDLLILENSGLDMYGWEYKNGEFVRQKLLFNGGIRMDAYSPQEIEYMIINNNSDKPEHRGTNYITISGMLNDIFGGYLGKGKTSDRFYRYITYRGMNEPMTFRWGENYIPVIDENGDIKEVQTSTFVVAVLEGRNKGLVAWYGKDGKPIVKTVEGKYLDFPAFFNKNWAGHSFEGDGTR